MIGRATNFSHFYLILDPGGRFYANAFLSFLCSNRYRMIEFHAL